MRRLFCLLPVVLFSINAHADSIQYLARPEQSLAAFDSAIVGATKTIDIATFIYDPCAASTRVLTQHLIAKAKAGVHVRVLLDALEISSEQRQQIENEFDAAGIDLRFYSNSLFEIDLRMHAKFMVVDGKTLIAGGRNLADQYFDMSEELNYVDRDFLAVGASSGAQGQAGFNLLWNSDMVTEADPAWGDLPDWISTCVDGLKANITKVQNYLKMNETKDLASAPVRSCNVAFNVDNPDFYKENFGPSWNNGDGAANFMTSSRLSRKKATNTVLNFLKNTKKTLTVENYEYIPITQLEYQFKQLRKRKIPVQILTNQDIEAEGPDFYVEAQEYELQKRQAADMLGSEWIGLVSSQGALNTSFALTPKAPPRFIHSKVMVRDDVDVLIGSFNTDARSANINVETASVISACPDLAKDVLDGAATIYSQFEMDEASPNPPPKPQPSPFAQWFGDLLLSQF
jgi:putative cardiolipin synthase